MTPVELAENAAHAIDREVARSVHAGRDVLAMHVGDPDLETPAGIREAATRALESGRTHYAPAQGYLRLRTAIVERWANRHHVPATADQVAVVSAKFAIYASLRALVGPGDEVVFPDPSYFFEEPVRLAGAVPVRFPLRPDHGLDLDALEAACTPRTRLIVLVSPGNPTGRLLKRDELRAAAEIARDHRAAMLSDEAYSELVYDGTHIALASVAPPGVPVVTVGSFSKTYAMSGWRAGFAIAPTEVTERIVQVVEHTLTCIPPFVQDACRWALEHGEADAGRILASLRERRDQLLGRLDDLPGISYQHPEGALYVFPRFDLEMTSVDFARRILAEESVAVAPGSAFGPHGEGHVRIAYALSPDRIDLAIGRLGSFLERHGGGRG